LVEDGDKITIDAEKKTIDWVVDVNEQERRRKLWEISGKDELKVQRGVLKRYARDVQVSYSVIMTGPRIRIFMHDSDYSLF
jgi:dihydroxy-acid dehydratase